ncbi:DnaJ domain [Popillia japonica]|uniref:Dnaj subfamily c member 8/lipopolysaccharide specific response-7-related n=5 Tax=Scarabaeidae TaxID=7055 RepID=A0ACB9SYG0_HOLOL|nr:dnaj subfamily c member 8/lipopolysaccharide specific response-7-related [Holotrichia oblita]KAI4459744.1 dnaj subfamily c member 8/lipopolysaccharide specific response-7-related [Holotrichia oblita]KAI4461431.1 dnaj subfamily c member 8/lipopolysaccharide specific response-7-related [Holotrichia oblita]KAI4469279.1 dnaj subfamily c member 8/lipopolysaccharide specific response-7-related [Holotrichia oblita]
MAQDSLKEHKEVAFNEFYTEVKEIEKRDSVLTPKQQIERLLRPGSTYFNLNPFEVLQVEPETAVEEVKKKYRRLSILVHPDKNQDDPDRAQQAFEVVNKAWRTLENEETRKKCLDIVEEAKGRTDIMLAEKRKKAKKEGKDGILEDNPERYKHAVYVLTMKLFADMERKRRELAERDQEERKRKREQEIEEEEKQKAEREWQKNFEESRQNRVESWQTFKAGSSKSKSSKKMKMFKPPKNKPESR